LNTTEQNTVFLKEKAGELGFFHCGIARAEYLEDEAPRLEAWLQQGMQGKMSYMNNYFEKRLDPAKLVEGAKSVVVLLYNYFPEKDLANQTGYKISKYAYGTDYHFVIKKKLRELIYHLKEKIGDFHGRIFVDSAPVLERAWAKRAGTGWVGKNSLLLNRQRGSFFFLAELILDIPFIYDGPLKDYCGTCTRCLDACPTDAIVQPYLVDGSKCISYLTIELKDEIPNDFRGKFQKWIFGCDICQDVCPWNSFSRPHREPAFAPNPALETMNEKGWQELTKEVFDKIFKKSAVKRTKYKGLKRNIEYVKNKSPKSMGPG